MVFKSLSQADADLEAAKLIQKFDPQPEEKVSYFHGAPASTPEKPTTPAPVSTEPFVNPFTQPATPNPVNPYVKPNVTALPEKPTSVPSSIAAPDYTGPTVAPVPGSAPASAPVNTGSGSASAPAPVADNGIPIPGANYTGDLQANRDAVLNPIIAQREQIKEAVANGSMNPAEAAKKTAALDIAEHKINGQYPLNSDGSINWQGIKPGQFSGKQLGIFQAGDQIHSANKVSDLAQQRIVAAKNILEAESSRNKAITEANQNTTTMLQNHEELMKQHQAEYVAGLQKVNDSYNEAVNDFKGTHIDPARYWRETPTAALIGIAVFAGLEQGFKGLAARGGSVSPSSIVQSVNTIVQQDIDAQKEELNKKGKEVDFANNAIAHFRAQGMDQQQADAAALNMGLTKAAQQVQTVLAQTEDPIAKAKGEDILLGLQQQAEVARQQAIGPAVAALAKNLAPVATGSSGSSNVRFDPATKTYIYKNPDGTYRKASDAEANAYENLRGKRAEGDKKEGEAAAGPKPDKTETELVATDNATGKTRKFSSKEERDAFSKAQEAETKAVAADKEIQEGSGLGSRIWNSFGENPTSSAVDAFNYAENQAKHLNEASSETDIRNSEKRNTPGIFSDKKETREKSIKLIQKAVEIAKAKGVPVK